MSRSKFNYSSLLYKFNIFQNKLAEMRSNMPSNGVSPDLKPKQHFIVKIQLPLALITSRKTKKNLTFEKEGQVYELCVYNEVSLNIHLNSKLQSKYNLTLSYFRQCSISCFIITLPFLFCLKERSVSGKIGPSFEYYNQLVDLVIFC